MNLPSRIYQGGGEWLIRPVEADAIGATVRVNGTTETVVVVDRSSEWVLVRVGDERSPYRAQADTDLAAGLVTTA